MKLKFQSDLSYQRQAIDAVVDIFAGQPVKQSSFTVMADSFLGVQQTELGIGNHLSLVPEEILENVQKIQLRNGLPIGEKLEGMNFTIEMETGTGKTYVYLRTIYELNRKYGFSKFIIVVPSVAIREGVNKSLEITREHFGELYDNTPAEHFIYGSADLSRVRQFATANHIQIMIINIDAFRKSFEDPEKENKANVIHRRNDRLNGMKPIEFIQQTNPIVIIDEPQSVDTTKKAKEAVASLNPLCTLRYSATHVDKYNMVYKLDAVDAYNQRLVKEIEVVSVRTEEAYNRPYIRLKSVSERKAVIELDVLSRGSVKRQTKTVRQDDHLLEVSGGRELYNGYFVEDICWEPGGEYITINGETLYLGQASGEVDPDAVKRFQIRKTIEEHLKKELVLRKRGIKVLSLFFIDRVAHYREYDAQGNKVKGKYAVMFEEEYKALIKQPRFNTLFEELDNGENIGNIHGGYFAGDKKGSAKGDSVEDYVWKDTKGNTKADDSLYSLIMRDKEKLLSLDNPLRFIFSHSALREGWDNPNVFQICTLKDSGGTYVSRRQEIGRGLRLAVGQSGERCDDYSVNRLTVMANESYEEFVDNLQKEIEADTGIRFGYVDETTFAGLLVESPKGERTAIGYELSKKMFQDLKQKGYINHQGKIQPLLKEHMETKKFSLSPELSIYQPLVEDRLIQLGRLRIRDGNKQERVELNKAIFESREFIDLWERIKHRTTYAVQFDSEKLIEKCVEKIAQMPAIKPPLIHSEKAKIAIDHDQGVTGTVVAETKGDYLADRVPLPDVVTILQNQTNLTRKTIVAILTRSKRLEDFKNNPQKYMEAVADIINREKSGLIVDGIKYRKIGGDYAYTMEIFQNDELIGYLNDNLVKSAKSPYNYVMYDSDVEAGFAKRFEDDENVKVYVKLPDKFKIDTPIGTYNPDWAVLIEKDGVEKLYFVVESKGTSLFEYLRPEEQAKIKCAREHFHALGTGVDFYAPESDPGEFMKKIM
ncbi:hypothetical protein SCACP_35170 [Sporomusa carbonis]|uniref:type III restriction-modification system endonuclease n=1 Tax=Sporomusa carbonis TaxID=3076075 RepID=UPI003A6ADEEC